MNKLFILILAVMGASLSGCGLIHTPYTIPPGHVGIVVDLQGSNKGIETQLVEPSRIWPSWNQRVYEFPTYSITKNYTATKTEDTPQDESFTFTSQEGFQFNIDVGVTYSLDKSKIITFFQKYRSGYEEINNRILRNTLRDAFGRYGGRDSAYGLIGRGKSDLIDSVQAFAARALAADGIHEISVFALSDVRPLNEDFKKAVAARAKAQEARTNLETARADSAKTMVAAAATAASNHMTQQSLTPELLTLKWIEKWSGNTPVYVSSGAGMMVTPNDIKALPHGKRNKAED